MRYRGDLFAAALALPCLLLAAPPAGAQGTANGTLTAPLAVEWKFTGNYFGNNPAAPVISNGTIFLSTGTRIYALDEKTGAQKWRYPVEDSATLQSVVQTTPAVGGDTLYVGSGDGLYAFGTADGKLRWRFSAPGGVNTQPVPTPTAVYFTGQNGRLYAVDPATGDTLTGIWNSGRTAGIDLGGDLTANAAVENGAMYYVTGNQILHVIDLTTGAQRYAQRIDADVRTAMPVMAGESMYMATGNLLNDYRAATGQRKWFVRLPDDAATPPAVDAAGNAYVVTTDRYVYAINDQGRSNWRKAVRVDEVVIARPVVAGNLLIVTTAQGAIYAYDTATGDLKWNYVVQPSGTNANYVPTTVNIAARPLVATTEGINGDALYVLSDDGTLTAFRHDAVDTDAPTVTELGPEQGDYLSGRPPFIVGARVIDEGSGVNISTLHLKLDGKDIPRRPQGVEVSDRDSFLYTPDDGRIQYSTIETEAGRSNSLKDGHHTIEVTVADWMGNVTNKTWSFVVDDTIKARARRPTNPNGRGGASGSGGPGRGGPSRSSGGGAGP